MVMRPEEIRLLFCLPAHPGQDIRFIQSQISDRFFERLALFVHG